MSKIKSRNTKPEILLRKTLWSQRIRYRINNSKIIGKPDIVLSKYKIAVFVDGEFWHGFKWAEKKRKIKANREYWIIKIEKNIKRDKLNTQKLKDNGWIVLRFWEHEIFSDLNNCVNKIKLLLN